MFKVEMVVNGHNLVIVKHRGKKPEVRLMQENGDTVELTEKQAMAMIEEEEKVLNREYDDIKNQIADLRIIRLQITENNGDRPASDYIPQRYTAY